MMVALTTTEMEITRGQPAAGYPVLMVLDEFAGLKRMAAIENAVAQIAGFGVKLFFVLQSLEQLKATYKDSWETFLANAGVKVFFSIEDHFTREYVSKLVGETELIREVHSTNESRSENESQTGGTSSSYTEGVNRSHSFTESFGTNESMGWSHGSSSGSSSSFGQHGSSSFSSGSNSSFSRSRGTSHGTSYGTTEGTSSSTTEGKSDSRTTGMSRTAGTGRSETLHRRPLIQPDEVGRIFARIDDRTHPFYPGMALVTITGADPLMVRRSHYFEDAQFIDCFSPHPDHAFLPAIANTVGGILPLIKKLEAAMNGKRLTIAQWYIEPGKLTIPGRLAAKIEDVPPDNRIVHIPVPYSGKVSETAARQNTKLSSGRWRIPDGPLFTVKNYGAQNNGIDPFSELREACRAIERKAAPKESAPAASELLRLWQWVVRMVLRIIRWMETEFFQGDYRPPERKAAPKKSAPASSELLRLWQWVLRMIREIEFYRYDYRPPGRKGQPAVKTTVEQWELAVGVAAAIFGIFYLLWVFVNKR
jgi:hypothetical protein